MSVRLGLAGFGAIGQMHARHLLEGLVPGGELVAVVSPPGQPVPPEQVLHYGEYETLLQSGGIDAVLVATPSHLHAAMTLQALQAGKHVLVEKPMALHLREARSLTAAATALGRHLCVMLNQRTNPLYAAIRTQVHSGRLGPIRRISWIMTNWFRPEIYYQGNPWRGTWIGEAGGVLLNQCVHNLDIFAWIFGLPATVRAFCHFGKYHDIEVEDEVTAYMEFDGGATATFITSTGEHPGANRLEIVGESGTLVAENNTLRITRLDVPFTEFSRTTLEPFASPAGSLEELHFDSTGEQHVGVLKDFVRAVESGLPSAYDAPQGELSLHLANAMLHSSFTGGPVSLPLDDNAYAAILDSLRASSKLREPATAPATGDISKSFR
jgi:predicted dehydrogenase